MSTEQPIRHALVVSWFQRDPGGGTLNVLPCRCETDPYGRTCGQWADNESACVCALNAAEVEAGQPLPS